VPVRLSPIHPSVKETFRPLSAAKLPTTVSQPGPAQLINWNKTLEHQKQLSDMRHTEKERELNISEREKDAEHKRFASLLTMISNHTGIMMDKMNDRKSEYHQSPAAATPSMTASSQTRSSSFCTPSGVGTTVIPDISRSLYSSIVKAPTLADRVATVMKEVGLTPILGESLSNQCTRALDVL
jgi:hypothetical protein